MFEFFVVQGIEWQQFFDGIDDCYVVGVQVVVQFIVGGGVGYFCYEWVFVVQVILYLEMGQVLGYYLKLLVFMINCVYFDQIVVFGEIFYVYVVWVLVVDVDQFECVVWGLFNVFQGGVLLFLIQQQWLYQIGYEWVVLDWD